MSKIFLSLVFIVIINAKWVMFGTDPYFLYNDENGEVFRYFEQDGKVGFGKVVFYKNIKLKPTSKNQIPNTTTYKDTVKLKAIQKTLMNNSLNQILK